MLLDERGQLRVGADVIRPVQKRRIEPEELAQRRRIVAQDLLQVATNVLSGHVVLVHHDRLRRRGRGWGGIGGGGGGWPGPAGSRRVLSESRSTRAGGQCGGQGESGCVESGHTP